MKILWINHRDPKHPEAGGAETHIIEVGKRLVKRGHTITLLTERFKGSKHEEELYGLKVKRWGRKFTLHVYAPYFVRKYSEAFDVIVDDIAHAVPFWSPMFTRKPVVAIVHHVHQGVVKQELPPILSHFVQRAERSIKEFYENIIAVSLTTKKDLIKRLGVPASKIKVIYHGIDHARYRPGPKFEEPTILWIGRMKRYKNLDHVVKAFELVKKVEMSARLLLVGTGEEEPKIKTLVRKKGLSNVIFTGRISEDDKIKLLQGAWCTVYTSEIEGWGMGVLEAAACGTPTIAYNVGALREAIIDGETGFLVKYGDINKLAEVLIEILTKEAIRKKLSEGALKYSRNFDWDKTTIETEKYLESCIVRSH